MGYATFGAAMITGFNTDVQHDGRVYHVQTEDRGSDKAVLESLVYVGGTIVAKKSTPYTDKLGNGATEEMIAALLKKQHQVIIAAIKAGRIEELIRHSLRQERARKQPPGIAAASQSTRSSHAHSSKSGQANTAKQRGTPEAREAAPDVREAAPPPEAPPQPRKRGTSGSLRRNTTAGLNLDQVISDYLNRSSGQARLEVKVLSPEVFIAGRTVGLRVQVTHDFKPEPDAIVTVKVIGTAFKPQVFIGRAGSDGFASFSINLPAFSAGTAAIVIEAQSGRGRGELKNLIRRA